MIRTSRNQKVRAIENDYNLARAVIKIPPMAPWIDYLESMLRETTWADTYFIRATALFLEMNIQIIDIAPTRGPNTYTYNGDPNPDTYDEARETLHIGVTNNTHFQSLLPDEALEEASESQPMTKDEEAEGDDNSENSNINNKNTSETAEDSVDDKCPSCKKPLKNILLHIKKSNKCQVSDKQLKELERRSKIIRKEKKKIWKEGKKLADPEQFKESQRDWKSQSRLKLNDEDYDLQKTKHRGHQATYEEKRKKEDPEAFKELKRQKNAQYRKDENEKDRLKKFLDATMHGPLFICISCHGRLFKISVRNFTEAMAKEIEEKIPIKNCIADMDILTMVVTENSNSIMTPAYKQNKLQVGSRFICETCWRYLKAGKLPPCSVMNSLALHDTDEKLKKDDHRVGRVFDCCQHNLPEDTSSS